MQVVDSHASALPLLATEQKNEHRQIREHVSVVKLSPFNLHRRLEGKPPLKPKKTALE